MANPDYTLPFISKQPCDGLTILIRRIGLCYNHKWCDHLTNETFSHKNVLSMSFARTWAKCLKILRLAENSILINLSQCNQNHQERYVLFASDSVLLSVPVTDVGRRSLKGVGYLCYITCRTHRWQWPKRTRRLWVLQTSPQTMWGLLASYAFYDDTVPSNRFQILLSVGLSSKKGCPQWRCTVWWAPN